MRILLSFLIGLLSFFYLGELFARISLKTQIPKKILPINRALTGILFIFLGFILSFSLRNDPAKVLGSIFLIGSGLGLTLHHFLSKHYIISEKLEHNFVSQHETAVERVLEILPGALMWLALTSPIWLSFTLPFAVAYVIIIADIYWLISSLRIAILIYIGYKKMDHAKKQNWLERLKKDFPNNWEDYYQLVLLPTYKEPIEVLAPAYDAVVSSNYPKDKIFLAIGFEARDSKEKINQTLFYLKKFEGKVAGIFTTIHPFALPGEVPGQGSNKNWMINHIVPILKTKAIPQDKIYVTTLDADFVIHREFLAGSLHKYLSTPSLQRDKTSYTGVFLYYNNYWQAPAPMRLIATGTALWQLSEMVGSDKYMNFSSLSINLKSLLDIGLWIPNKVNDDSGFYWKAYYHFNGDYKVLPHYLPISADTVLDITLFKTFQNQYLQLKRWAYGVEHIPFIVKNYFQKPDLDFWDKTDKLLFALWGYLRWGALALFITFASLLIPRVNPSYSQSVVAYNLPVISSYILTAAFISLFSTIYVHEKTAPKRPRSWSVLQKIWSYIQWVLIPIILVTISTIPAIDAQTSLMLGRYLEFRVTNKTRL